MPFNMGQDRKVKKRIKGNRGMGDSSFSTGSEPPPGGGFSHQDANPRRDGSAGGQHLHPQQTTWMSHDYRGGWQPSQHGGRMSSPRYGASGGADIAPSHRRQHGHAAAGSHHQHNIPIHPAHQQQQPMYGSGYQQPVQPYYPPQQYSSSSFQPTLSQLPLVPPAAVAVGVVGATAANAAVDVHAGGSAYPLSNEELLQQQEDIERGLRIDFYTEPDPAILASWASFFRDRFVEVRHELTKATFDRNAETYRRATHFAERVESKILSSNAAKKIFRRYPLTPINDPFFVDTCYRAIIDYAMRNPPFDGFTFGNPAWRDYMWFKAGLMKLVEDSRNKFLEWYANKIRDTIDTFIQTQVSSKSGDVEKETSKKLIEEALLHVSNSGMVNEASYTYAKRFYAFLLKEVLSELDPPSETNASAPPDFTGKRVREFFGVEEEAFVLSALRSSLENMAKQHEGETRGPPPQDVASSLSSTDKILSTAVEISQMLANQEAQLGFESPVIHFDKEGVVSKDSTMAEDNVAEQGESMDEGTEHGPSG